MEKELSQLSLLCHCSLLYIHLVSKNYGWMYPSLLLSYLCPCCSLYHLCFLADVPAVIFFNRFTISNPPLQRYQVILNILIRLCQLFLQKLLDFQIVLGCNSKLNILSLQRKQRNCCYLLDTSANCQLKVVQFQCQITLNSFQ